MNIMNMVGVPSLESVMAKFTTEVKGVRRKQAQAKERLRREWEETRYMPRKLKKCRRKEILEAWAMADYDILGGVTDEELDNCFNVFRQFIAQEDEESTALSSFL